MVTTRFVHFEQYEEFEKKKISANRDNTLYIIPRESFSAKITGEPDISYQSICFIHDKQLIYTHGQFYSQGVGSRIKRSKILGVDKVYEEGTTSLGIEYYDEYGNPVTNTEEILCNVWEYFGYGEGPKDDYHNWIEEETGILHINLISQGQTGRITCTTYFKQLGVSAVTSKHTVDMIELGECKVGYYVFADGSYGKDPDENKTAIGVCFYINPDNPKERLAICRKSNLGNDYWGLYNTEEYMAGVELQGSKLSSSEIYDLPDLANISGSGLSDNTWYLTLENYVDENGEFYDYKTPNGLETYTKTAISTGHAASGLIGFCTTIEDVEDDQLSPSQWAVWKEGKWVVPKGTRVPWGFIQTLYIIHHRNEILNTVILSDQEEQVGLPIPTKTSTKSEWEHLASLMSEIGSKYSSAYRELYYPAASKCHAYSPEERTGLELQLKEGEVLNAKFRVHNWFLPAAGDLARLLYYHLLEYGEEKSVLPDSTEFEKFPALWFWSSSESGSGGAWGANFSGGGFGNRSKFYSGALRPVVAF